MFESKLSCVDFWASFGPQEICQHWSRGHITAASPKGPRYDASLTSTERRSPENGLWCCQTCGKLVDNDPDRYTVDELKEWKRLSERAAELECGRPKQITVRNLLIEI